METHFSYRGWVLQNLIKNKNFQKGLLDRVKLLDTGFSFSKVMERKIRSIGGSRRRIPHVYDPILNNLRLRIPVPQTFLTGSDLHLTSLDKLERRKKIKKGKEGAITKKNSIKYWISAKNDQLKPRNRNPLLPWETLTARARLIFQFIFKNRGVLYDDDVQKIIRKVESSSSPVITWEEIMNLDPEDQSLFLTYIRQEENYKFDQIFLSNVFLGGRRHPSNTSHELCTLHKIEDLGVNLARNNELYFDTEFDFPGADGDIRHRKLRNVGFTFAREKSRSTKLVKRYARISDFRRKFLKGSMRSRRRKTLLCKTFQEKVRSSFFPRLIEIPMLIQLPIKLLTGSKNEQLLNGSKKIMDAQLGQQLNSYLSPEKRLSKSKLAHLAIAARSDTGPIHNGRGYMLIFQSRFRKFIKLPVLIVFKSIGRILLRQNSEWNKDWTKWKKETHINCTFDGEEFSQDQLPPRWVREGIQIKIAYPFRLKPWHCVSRKKGLTSRKKYMKTKSIEGQKYLNKRRLNQTRTRFTYLTALGYQTDIPFGSIQKQPSFWKPVRKELVRICREVFSMRTKQAYRFLDSKLDLKKILKPSIILLKRLNLFFKPERVSADFVSTDNIPIKPVLHTGKNEEVNSNFDKKYIESINIAKEMQPVGKAAKQSVNKESTSKEFVADNYRTKLANSLDEVDKLDTETTQVDELSLNYRFKDTDSVNFLKFDEQDLTDLKGIILKLHLMIAETIDKSILVASIWYLKVSRDLYYYFSNIVAFQKQLVEVINTIIQETDLILFRTKKILLQFSKTQSLSQAYLYNSIWNLNITKSLNLKLLSVASENNREEKTKNNECWNGNLISYQSEKSVACPVKSSELSVQYDSNISGPSEISNSAGILFGKITNKTAKEKLDEQVLNCVEEWGFLKKLSDLDTSNWNRWLDCFSNYNVPLTLWRDLAPHRWKISFDCLNELNNIEEKVANKREYGILQNELDNYSIYAKKPLIKHRIINLSKIRKRRYLLQNFIDFVRNGDMQKFSIRQDATEQRFCCENRILKINKIRQRGMNRLPNFCISDSEMRFNSKIDVMSWLDFARTESSFKKKAKRPINPILKDNITYGILVDINRRFQKVADELYEIMLDEREDIDYLFRWKWKSETKLENLRSLTALTRMLGDDRDLVTLCINTNVDSELLDRYFNATTKLGLFSDLSFLSAHRLSLLLDDQNLVYKIINPLLKFRSRLKNKLRKCLYKKVYSDTYIFKLSLLATELNRTRFHIYNLEDLLLLRRRRELRFLQSMLILRSPKSGTRYFDFNFDSILKIERLQCSKEYEFSRLREIQKIKRFLWPSHRLEELACTGRFCFNVTTGNQFAILKIRMYPIIRN